ncbi:MAG TPA: S26 family signal peptidase [Burkholderiaceae bacterium]|nr:S26 family signal peptidase [Burkholderiaceae bacterium]
MKTCTRRCLLVGCAILGVAALGAPAAMRLPISIVYNASDSVPRGWYRVSSIESAGSLHVGSIVLARLPADAAMLAAQRGYLHGGIPILKTIGATPSQFVCVRERVVRIDGATVATVRARDGAFRPLPSWAQCRPLEHDELFLLSRTNPASFDSRYFGPIQTSDVLGIAQRLCIGCAHDPG